MAQRSFRGSAARFTARLFLALLGPMTLAAAPQNPASERSAPLAAANSEITIPRIDRPPTLEDFLEMAPASGLEGKMAKVEDFIQRDPRDGQPASQRTVTYLGYDDKQLYVVFVAFDTEPSKIRARLTRRENIYDDDLVQIMLDTFHDRRRAYSFVTNPLGIQLDRLYTEGAGFDDAFDTVWHSHGRLTDRGYVVWMAIPFRSLRFPPSGESVRWGIVLQRIIPRLNETVFWPRISSRIEGRLTQEGTASGLRNISPGRNIQLIPYAAFRSFRALDLRDPAAPRFRSDSFEGDLGLDAKFVLKDRLVLDFTLNPDFSQVESDEPQNTVNQRFEVFFPEKRPFFQENSSFFETPINLLFTRRIADPQLGVRATGKLGPYALGLLFADDQSPGRSVPAADPLAGKRAYFGILRVNRDIGQHQSIGVIYAERRLLGSYNRVGGADIRFRFGKNRVGNAQAVTSSTRFLDGTTQAGPAYEVWAQHVSRKVIFNTLYLDTSRGFLTQTGFFRRPDVRRFSNFARYRFRPEGKRLISHGPAVFQLALWAHDGTPLEQFYNVNYSFEFARQTNFGAFGNVGRVRLPPAEFSALPADRDYGSGHRGFFFHSAFFPQLSMFGEVGWGRDINFGPATGPPVSARSQFAETGLTLRPISPLAIENRYILSRLRVVGADSAIFNNHIFRSKWNYQISRELSLRFIVQYNPTLANSQFSSLSSTKNLNFDFLITWLLRPGTAVYVGYNSNLQNLDPSLATTSSGLLRTRDRFLNDGRQLFVKASYLFRF